MTLVKPASLLFGCCLLLAACGGAATAPASSAPPAAPASSSAASKPPATSTAGSAAASTSASAGAASTSNAASGSTAASGAPSASGSSAASGAPSASGSSAASTAASGAAAGEPYKLSLVVDMTGPYASLGVPIKAAIELELKQLNASGGINGHPVELLAEDSQSDPSKGVLAIKKNIDQKPVAAIGPSFSSTSLAAIPIEEAAKLPTMTEAADESQVNPVRKYVFMTPPTTKVQVDAMLPYFKAANITKIAVINDTSAFGTSAARDIKELESKYGVQMVQNETYNIADTDMTAQLTKIKNNPDVQAILQWGAGAAPVIVTKNYAALGFKIPLYLSNASNDEAFVKAAGAAANGRILPTTKLPVFEYLLPTDPSQKVLADFLPAYKQATGQDANLFAGLGYDAFHIMTNAIKTANSTDPDKIVAALEQTKFEGTQGTYQFSPTNHAGFSIAGLAMAKIQDGKFVPVKPNCPGCFDTK